MIIHLYLFVPSIIRTQLKPKVNLKTSRPETGDTHNNGHWLTHTITHQCWVLLWSAVPRVSSRRQGLARRAGSSRRGSRSRRRCYWPTSRRSSTEWSWSLRYSSDPHPFCWTQVFLFLTHLWLSQDEEGPDIKAASPDILLVHATEMDSIVGRSSPHPDGMNSLLLAL